MILVTGGTGLVGAHLLVELTKTESAIRAIHRTESNLKNVEKIFSYYSDDYLGNFNKIEWICADINDIPALEIAFDGISHVYHCAALISFDPKDFNKLLKINSEGTANIINLSLVKNIKKLCYVSSIATIGRDLNSIDVNEESDWNSKEANVYALSKYAAEMEVWRGSQEGLPVIIFNPGVILGPGFWNTGSGKLFKIASKGYKYFPPNGTGYISVNDVVKLLILGMKSDLEKERFITISKNETYQEILKKISAKLNIKPPVKEFKLWQLEILWRLDWLKSIVTNKERKITQNMVKSLSERKVYANKKVVDTFNYSFESIDDTITFCVEKYNSENS